jgi:hypothetical protein
MVLVPMQPDIKMPDKELLLLNPEVKDGQLIMENLSLLPDFYSFSPDGNRIVFQVNLSGGKENDTEVWYWDWDTGKTQKLATGDKSPQWLP